MTASKFESVSGLQSHFQSNHIVVSAVLHLAVAEPFREANQADMIYDPTAV